MNSKGVGSLLVSGGLLRGVLGRLRDLFAASGSVLGCLGSVLGGKTVLEPSWSRFGAVLEASWRRLGDVLGRLGSVLGAYLFEGSWAVLEPLGASWKHLVLDFHTKRWLHASLAAEIQFFIGFLRKFASNFDTRKPTKRQQANV